MITCTDVQVGLAVDRGEFEALVRLPGKGVAADIVFVPRDRLISDWVVFEKAPVANALDLDILLNGGYHKKTGSTTFNFVLRGVGPICRVNVNGEIHGNAGRTHKHELMKESDPRKDLPHAVARPDFENLSPREIWERLCRLAKIEHTGAFVDPSDSP